MFILILFGGGCRVGIMKMVEGFRVVVVFVLGRIEGGRLEDFIWGWEFLNF